MNTLLTIGLGAAALIGGAYLLRKRQQAVVGERCADLAQAVETVKQGGTPQAIAYAEAALQACKGASWLDDALGNPFEGTADRNIRLNGAPKRRAHSSLMGQTQWETFVPGVSTQSGYIKAEWPGDSEIGLGVIEYANGCVPFPGADGWEKCAAGTRPQCKPVEVHEQDVLSYACRAIGQGGAGDPLTRRHRSKEELGQELAALNRDGAKLEYHGWHTAKYWEPFPRTCAPGEEAWWAKGQPLCVPKCAPGAVRDERTTDNRPGATGVPPCMRTGVSVPPPRSGPAPGTYDPNDDGPIILGGADIFFP